MPYPSEYACRLESPDKYDSFRRQNCAQKHDNKCIDVIYGIKGTGKNKKSETQSLRYPVKSWKEAAAKTHCKSRDGTFEAAAKPKKEVQNMSDQLFYRNFEFDRTKLDKEKRSIELSLSSNTPIEQYFETIILLHGKANVDLSILNSALLSHDSSKIIGKYEKKHLKDDQLRATLIFDDDELGNFAMGKVESGSLKGASIAFTVSKFKRLEQDEEWENYKGPVFIATKWAPYEASLTPIPADSTVGIGRDLSQSLDGIEIEYLENHINQLEEDKDMDEKEVKTLIDKSFETAVPEIVKQVRSVLEEKAKPKMKIETEILQDLLGRAGAVSLELKSKVSDMAVVEGKTEQEITKVILDAATGNPDAEDHGDGSPDGTGTKGKKAAQKGAIVNSFEQVEDGAFFAGLSKPSMFPMN